MHTALHVKLTVIPVTFLIQIEFSRQIFEIYSDIKFNFKKIRPAAAKLIHTDGQTWWSSESSDFELLHVCPQILRTRLKTDLQYCDMWTAFICFSVGCSNERSWTWQRGCRCPKQRGHFIHSTPDNFAFLHRSKYRYAPQDDFSVNDGRHILNMKTGNGKVGRIEN